MTALQAIRSKLLAGATLAALAFGGLTLTAPPTSAFPVLLCGPIFLWSCSNGGDPEVSVDSEGGDPIVFAGTICEKLRFEAQTGLTCTLFGG